MKQYVIGLQEINDGDILLVGGKGLNLGKLSKLSDISVPDGFCLTTEAFKRVIQQDDHLLGMVEELNTLKSDDRSGIEEITRIIREIIQSKEIEDDLSQKVANELEKLGINNPYAVRSSATAEDLLNASFAGQQDTYLNVVGKDNILNHIKKCWASLYSERAVSYRLKNGFDNSRVYISVIIQRMIFSEASGVMFTADPMTSDRETIVIDAGYGIGEGIVSGLMTPDCYQVFGDKIIHKSIGTKIIKIKAKSEGGTYESEVSKEDIRAQVLSDKLIMELAAIGKRLEDHFGYPQDIEWCTSDNIIHIVQSRPITTLFPLPEISGKKTPRVYMSIGHVQMMTDPFKPLGMSFFKMISEVELDKIGGRIYSDITHDLSSVVGKKRLVMATGKQDPLIQGAIKVLLGNSQFMKSLPKGKRNVQGGIFTLSSILETLKVRKTNNPGIIKELTSKFKEELRNLDNELSNLSGLKVIDYIEKDRQKLLDMAYDPKMLGAIITSILAYDSINKKVAKLVGEKNAADTLTKSLEHNITTEMGLALGDLADIVRNYPDIVQFMSDYEGNGEFIEKLSDFDGGNEINQAFQTFLDRFGMRCPGEIDITRARFAEEPEQLIPVILNNIRILSAGEHRARFKQGKEDAETKKNEIISEIKKGPGGNRKAKSLEKSISILRNFSGCREDPKYYIVTRFNIYKKALLKEAEVLVKQGILEEAEDVNFLFIEELRDTIINKRFDIQIIEKRKKEYELYEKLTPPRVITSGGFVPSANTNSIELPFGALAGMPVSAGVVEGRARVVASVAEAKLEKGDILVTKFTDPSWTPLFVTASGLVTEVGGFTTHGSIVAREYGLPGVVGVVNATRSIKDGQMIRVNGNEGYVELLE